MAEPAPLGKLVRGLRAEIRNWYWLGPLGWVVMPSRCPPRPGLLNRSIARRTVTVRLRSGGTIRCRINELFAVVEVFALATYDTDGIDWAAAANIVDVGANVGAATIWMARRAPAARIVAVEPSPEALASLRGNVKANGLEDRVTVVGCALGAVAGTALLATGGTTVSQGVKVATGPSVPVAVKNLASVMESADMVTVDVIKMDCEGAEYEIIRSMGSELLLRVKAVVGEYHPLSGHSPEELEHDLRAAGFSCTFRGSAEIGTFIAIRSTQPVS
jgi:FkbM family methyltransferase